MQELPSSKPADQASPSLNSGQPSQIKKRDGRIVPFDREKITNAIFKAILATGGREKAVAERLSELVVKILAEKYGAHAIPTVEDVQDVVERVLVENGMAKTAKAYILYRQKRAEIRREKQRILEKVEIDEVDKQFDLNALRVLKARYLRKDRNGKLIETPKALFTRVAIHVTLPNLLYDERVYAPEGMGKIFPHEDFNPEPYENKLSIGGYSLNRYHLEALKRMYDRFNSQGRVKVSWGDFLIMLEKGDFSKYASDIKKFYDVMVSKRFIPNTPALANFGNPLGMGSACFVLDIDDSIESIMEALKKTAIVFKAGGGMGYNFSKLRPEGDFVSSTSGIASGPISFMMLFDTMTEVIKQGGIRRGANMGILNSNHPDIEKFITAKKGNRALRNFNISVMIMPDFWECYRRNEPYPLVNPRNGEIVRKVNPRLLFDMIVYQAWESGEPGVIFFDHVNNYNPFLKTLGPIFTTNPCGEVLLYPNESCNLGSINVWAFVREDEEGRISFDWEELAKTVETAVRFLDNVVDINKFPLKEIEEMTLNTRKIGLGVMGVADLLFEMKLPYDSEEGKSFMGQLMEFINYHSKLTSIQLAQERGKFPYFEKSFYTEGRLPFSGFENKSEWHLDWDRVMEGIRKHGLRNAYTTVIAPTGSISMIAGCSSGIEPVYSLVYEKSVKIGSFYYVDPVFEKVMIKEGLYDEALIKDVEERNGSVRTINYLSEKLKRIFVTAHDISPEDHVKALAEFQKWVDSSISKTINFPAAATVDDMKKCYLLGYELGCKDITVFRDTSITGQVLVVPKIARETSDTGVPSQERGIRVQGVGQIRLPSISTARNRPLFADERNEFNFCPQCGMRIIFREGCSSCPECGWGLCS
jgi:ribonucleoside-diphosphate reductase alpha chain